MNWKSPQTITAVGSLICGFVLVFLDFFLTETHLIHDSTLYVLGQSFLYAGAIFGVKGYVDQKMISFRSKYFDTHGTNTSRQHDRESHSQDSRVSEE